MVSELMSQHVPKKSDASIQTRPYADERPFLNERGFPHSTRILAKKV